MKLGLAFVLFLGLAGIAGAWEAQVVGVKDGDTLVVYDGKEQTTIRLEGIDAPEHNQAFGEKAKQFTSGMVFGKKVRIDGTKKDDYGRTLAEVFVGGKNLNDELLLSGLAWHYKKYSKNKNRDNYESLARSMKRGLWNDANPVPPWEFRHGKETAIKKPDTEEPLSPRNQAEYDRAVKSSGSGENASMGSNQSINTGQSGSSTYTGPRGGQYHYSESGNKVYNRKR